MCVYVCVFESRYRSVSGHLYVSVLFVSLCVSMCMCVSGCLHISVCVCVCLFEKIKLLLKTVGNSSKCHTK